MQEKVPNLFWPPLIRPPSMYQNIQKLTTLSKKKNTIASKNKNLGITNLNWACRGKGSQAP